MSETAALRLSSRDREMRAMFTPAAPRVAPMLPTTPGESSFSQMMIWPSGTASRRNWFTRTMRASFLPKTVPATTASPPSPRTVTPSRLT